MSFTVLEFNPEGWFTSMNCDEKYRQLYITAAKDELARAEGTTSIEDARSAAFHEGGAAVRSAIYEEIIAAQAEMIARLRATVTDLESRGSEAV